MCHCFAISFLTAICERIDRFPPRRWPDPYVQIVGGRNVRNVPDVAVTGANASSGLVDCPLGLLVPNRTAAKGTLAGGRDR